MYYLKKLEKQPGTKTVTWMQIAYTGYCGALNNLATAIEFCSRVIKLHVH